jgi:hypothetical protein
MKKKDSNPTEICGICRMYIYLLKDNYCILQDYFQGKFAYEGFYHTKCYNDRLKGGAELDVMKKKTMALLKKASEMIGVEETPEVIRI